LLSPLFQFGTVERGTCGRFSKGMKVPEGPPTGIAYLKRHIEIMELPERRRVNDNLRHGRLTPHF
jgi:hypothetical protein